MEVARLRGGDVGHAVWRRQGGDLTIEIRGGAKVKFVGAVDRWDQDGNPRKPVNPKAKIEAPEVQAVAQEAGGSWVFRNLAAGKYDLVILAGERLRVEGF